LHIVVSRRASLFISLQHEVRGADLTLGFGQNLDG
jgi:hypothetical protein